MTRPMPSLRCASCELRCYELPDEIAKQVIFFRGQGEDCPCSCLRDLPQIPLEPRSLPDLAQRFGQYPAPVH